MGVNVTKRDGTTEPFSLSKIRKVIIAAGLSEEQADKLIAQIESWAKTTREKSLTSLQIRDQVLLELEKVDEYSANMYRWYQKTKEANPVSSN